jgi:hypothetical protein
MKWSFLLVVLLLASSFVVSCTDELSPPCEPPTCSCLGAVDPNYTALAYDGFIIGTDAVYNTAWTKANGDVVSSAGIATVGQYNSTNYYIDKAFLYYDTTPLPATVSILSASLYLYGRVDASIVDFNLTIQQGSGIYPSNYPDTDNNGLAVGDYDKSQYSGDGGHFDTSGWATSAYNVIPLNSTGIGYIVPEGITKLAIRSSREISGTAPSGYEYVTFDTYGESYPPLLEITYSCGASWLSDYNYYKLLRITGSTAGTQTNYQMLVNVYAAAGTDSGGSVYTNYTTQTDFDDVRFTTTSGTSLDFWQESYTSNVSAVFWVEFDSIAASPSVTSFLMYYGNSAATSGSNGDNTFIFFDDFPGTSLNTSKWSGDTGYATVSGGILTYQNGAPAWGTIRSTIATGNDTFAMRGRGNLDVGEAVYGTQSSDALNAAWAYRSGVLTYILTRNSTAQTSSASNFAIDAYSLVDLHIRGNVNTRAFEGGAERTGSPKTTNPPGSTDMRAAVGAYSTNAMLVDWILLRKYVYPEPSISSWGSQNILPAPTGISATDGTYTDKVVVSWAEPCGVTGYYLYRSGTYVTSLLAGNTSYSDTGAAEGTITGGGATASSIYSTYVRISVDGATVVNGTTYTYTLKSYVGTANGTASAGNTGYRGVGSLTYDWKYHDGTGYIYLPGAYNLSSSIYDDTTAPKPIIYPGSCSATDGNTNGITIDVTGCSIVDGLLDPSFRRLYLAELNATGATTTIRGPASGWKQAGTLTYQAWRSSGDAASDYSVLGGATTPPDLDTTTPIPTINAGNATATDGTYNDKVALNITNNSITTYGRYYLWEVSATGSDSKNSTADRGYWGYGTPTYQWYRSNSTSDADFSVLSGATTSLWDDTTAPAGTITPGSAVASDGSSSFNITIDISGNGTIVGEVRYYLLQIVATGATSQNSTHDDGYRNVGAVQLQLMRSLADSDTDYSNVVNATSAPYIDAAVPIPTITPGVVAASDGLYTDYVYTYLNGTSFNDAEGRYYLWTETADGAATVNSTSDRGYEGIGPPEYQWQRTADDEDWGFSNMTGAVSASLNDTTAPAGTIADSLAIASDALYADKVTLSLFGGTATNGSRRYFRCVLNGLGATEQISSSNRGFRSAGDATYQWFISAVDSDANFSNITSSGLTDYAYNTTNGVFYPSGRFYLAEILADGAISKNATADRGNFYSDAAGCGVPATITSDSSSGITFFSALLSGNVSDEGCSNVTLRGFQWGVASGCYTGASYEIGDFGIGEFNYTAFDLSPVTTYFWRAYGMNGNGTAYGGELNFTTLNVTLPLPPTDFTATQVGSVTSNGTYSVNLTWTMGINTTRTVIRGSVGGYPANLTDGNSVYNGTGTWVLVTGLSLDTVTYGYSAWGENSFGDSLDHAEAKIGGKTMLAIFLGIIALGVTGLSFWRRFIVLTIGSSLSWLALGILLLVDPGFLGLPTLSEAWVQVLAFLFFAMTAGCILWFISGIGKVKFTKTDHKAGMSWSDYGKPPPDKKPSRSSVVKSSYRDRLRKVIK